MNQPTNIPAPRGTASGSAKPVTTVPPPPNFNTPHFLTDPNSPFKDKYSIEREREALKHLDSIPDDQLIDHDDFPRLEELVARENLLKKQREEYRGHKGADIRVPYPDTTKIDRLGRLVNPDEESDTMLLHTRQAFRVFVGRRADPENKTRAIPSAKRIGTVLKILHDLSRFDNPYADWALLRADEHLRLIKEAIRKASERFNAQLAELETQGIRINVLRSAAPQEFKLEFASSYGYMLCEMIVQFDYFVRLVTTMVKKGQLTDDQQRPALSPIIGSIRSFFGELARYERVLAGEHLRRLSRSDYLPGANETAKKRVEAAMEIFGMVPAEIFKGELVPAHTKRRVNATAQDVKLLGQIYDQLTQEAELEVAADANLNAQVEANKVQGLL